MDQHVSPWYHQFACSENGSMMIPNCPELNMENPEQWCHGTQFINLLFSKNGPQAEIFVECSWLYYRRHAYKVSHKVTWYDDTAEAESQDYWYLLAKCSESLCIDSWRVNIRWDTLLSCQQWYMPGTPGSMRVWTGDSIAITTKWKCIIRSTCSSWYQVLI